MDNRHGRRRGGFEQAKVGDTVAFGEVAAGWHQRRDILGKLTKIEGNRATLDTGEVIVHREVVPVPTPSEIEARCEIIQAGWTRSQWKRAGRRKPLAVDDDVYCSRDFYGGHRGPEGT